MVEIKKINGDVIYIHPGNVLNGANLSGAKFTDANLEGCFFDNANLEGAKFDHKS
jgi:uncharacterized protein YjbI with pentapeptide repeats